jgi:hypothetical protein
MTLPQQPSFTTPRKALEFIRVCLQQDDTCGLYAAFTQETSQFWKDRLVQSLRQIQDAETLERVFLEDGRITAFPEDDTVLRLGGHNPRTHYLHITLKNSLRGWVLESIHVCR